MSEVERDPGGLLTVETLVCPSRCSHSLWKVNEDGGAGQVSIVANDQHQPASSRAIAVLATVCFLFLAARTCQR